MKTLKESVLFQNSAARWLLLGQLLSQVFDRVTSIGLVWLLTQNFSLSATSWFLAIGGLPHILFSLHSGRFIGKVGIVRTMILSDLFRCLLYAGAAAAALIQGGIFTSLAPFFALAFLSNIAASVFNPAVLTLPILLANEKHAQSLTAMLTSCSSFSIVLGPLVAILLLNSIGLNGIFLVTAVAYGIATLASIVVARKLNPVNSKTAQTGSFLGLTNPVLVLQKYRLIGFMLFSFLAMNILLGPLQIIFPAYAREVYGQSFNALAWLETSLGAGMVIGSVTLSLMPVSLPIMRSISIGLFMSSLCLLAFAISRDFTIGRLAIGVFGFFLSCANVLIINLFQQEPNEKDVPGVMALVNMMGIASVPLSLALSSGIVMLIPIRTFALFCAIGFVLVTLATVRRFDIASKLAIKLASKFSEEGSRP